MELNDCGVRIAEGWSDYSVIATGNGEKLERWGRTLLLRPDPQIIWSPGKNLASMKYDGRYNRDSAGGGAWEYRNSIPDEWVIGWGRYRFLIKPMGFKHTGLFPEQAVNWKIIDELIKNAGRPISVLNLFAYTGGATVAAIGAGASVCHVDAAKNMNERAKKNLELSGLKDKPARFIADDCRKFIKREIQRGRKYDAIIMDPPSYGRGAGGEVWKLEDDLYDFLLLAVEVLSENPLFVLINSYTTGLQPTVLKNLLTLAVRRHTFSATAYEVCLPTEEGILLPCGASGLLYRK